jgi:hypothetical protein
MSFFFFFSYTTSENRTEQVLPGMVSTSGRGRSWGKGVGECYGANTVYTCMYMKKWYLLKLLQEWEEEGDKGEWWGR